jgi:hypothetical protein
MLIIYVLVCLERKLFLQVTINRLMAVNVCVFIFKLLAQARKPGQEVLILIKQHMLLQGNTVRQWEQVRRDGPT